MRILTIFTALLIGLGTLGAQEYSFGFKAGLNFSTLEGQLESAENGSELEELNLTRGFHFGPIFNLKLTDVFGLRAELLYSQKGVDYKYNGQSFWIFYPENENPFYHNGGNRNMRLFVNNSYLDLPLMAVVRLGRIEASAGVNVGLLLSSRATGEITYTSANVEPFTIALEYNFAKDEPTIDPGEDPFVKSIAGQGMFIPQQVGAYYGPFGRDNKLYNALDLGVNAGLSFYLSQGLFVGFRMNYGLLDTTKEEQDISAAQLGDNNTFLKRNDVDKNISLQASVGFSF